MLRSIPLTILAGLCGLQIVSGQGTQLISSTPSGLGGNGTSGQLSGLSADGRFIAFTSSANDLVSGDTNGVADVFVRDTLLGVTTRVSVSTAGVEGDSNSSVGSEQSISANGRFVAFESGATTLAPGANGQFQVYIHDRQTGQTSRASRDAIGNAGNSYSGYAAIAGDGSSVVFLSFSTNLVAADTNGLADIFRFNFATSVTTRESVDSAGNQANLGAYGFAAVSHDGHKIAFISSSTSLVTGDTNGAIDAFLRDVVAGTTIRVSVGPGGQQANADIDTVALSGDGRFVAFSSFATNLVAGDSNGYEDVFVRDVQTGTTSLESVSTAGAQQMATTFGTTVCALSFDGRYLVFQSQGSNLVPEDANQTLDIFARDRLLGTTWRLSVDHRGLDGMNTHISTSPTISADGSTTAYYSEQQLLSAIPSGTGQVYARRTTDNAAFTAYCFGDDAPSACPCGPSTNRRGCTNSVPAGGARLTAVGNPGTTPATDTLMFFASDVPGPCVLLQSANRTAPTAFGDGTICVASPTTRISLALAVLGTVVFPDPAAAGTIHTLGGTSNGDVRHYQAWYRDSVVGFCTPATFNLSPGLTVAWGN